jgi:hypothetical protein
MDVAAWMIGLDAYRYRGELRASHGRLQVPRRGRRGRRHQVSLKR